MGHFTGDGARPEAAPAAHARFSSLVVIASLAAPGAANLARLIAGDMA